MPTLPKRPAAGAAALVALVSVAGLAPSRAADGPTGERLAGPARLGDAGAVVPAASTVTPPALDDVEHMCALLTGCPRLPFPSGFVPRDLPGCVRALAGELASPRAVALSLTLRECGLRASSCGELRTCALRGARPGVCAGRGKAGPVDMCDESGRGVTCAGERPVLVRDCPRGGEQCVVRDGKALCALGTCDADAPPACSASGTRILECRKGKLASSDCAPFGLRCVATADGPQCATDGPPCAEGAVRCEGDVAVTCFRGREVKVDCGAAHLRCAGAVASSQGSPMGACEVPPPADTPCDGRTKARCSGATLEYCAYGRSRAYLCKSMGLSRCVSDDTGARCAP